MGIALKNSTLAFDEIFRSLTRKSVSNQCVVSSSNRAVNTTTAHAVVQAQIIEMQAILETDLFFVHKKRQLEN